jgi:hypothetical protein
LIINTNRYINIVVGLIFIFNFYSCEKTIPQDKKTNNPISKDPETFAIVQSIKDFNTYNHHSEIYVLNISYYVGGDLIESSISFNSSDIKVFNKGDSLKISYKKNNPENFQINSSNNKLWLENWQKLWQLMQSK